jgi:hypothetical protein
LRISPAETELKTFKSAKGSIGLIAINTSIMRYACTLGFLREGFAGVLDPKRGRRQMEIQCGKLGVFQNLLSPIYCLPERKKNGKLLVLLFL